MPQTCNSRLEARVVVEGDLVVHVLLTLIHVMIVLVGTANESALQKLRVLPRPVEGVPTAGCWPRGARTAKDQPRRYSPQWELCPRPRYNL
jgi:hypothetical protein